MRRLFLLIVILVSSACANTVDDSENVLVVPKIEGNCTSCLEVGAVYSFTELALENVEGGSPTLNAALNGAWANDISKGELSVYLRVEKIDANGVTFRLVNGARIGTDGAKCLVSETEVDLSLPFKEEGGMGPSQSTDLYVYAGSEAHPKNCNPTAAAHAIPVVNVVATVECSGVCNPRQEDTLAGEFTAALAKEDLFGTCVCLDLSDDKISDDVCGSFSADYVSEDGKCDGCGEKYNALDGLIPAFNGGNDLDWESCNEAVGAEAACLTARFKAVRISPFSQYCCPALEQCTDSWTPNGTDCTPSHKDVGVECDDEDAATSNDQCDGEGTCKGEPVVP